MLPANRRVENAWMRLEQQGAPPAELLSPRRESTSGCLQPFRFVALDDQDHSRLRMAMESLLDQSVVRAPSSKGTAL